MKTLRTRSYSELKSLTSFIDRFRYLRLDGRVGTETFGFDRYLNQVFYNDPAWKEVRRHVIIRDQGCDLGCEDHPIPSGVKTFVHHINPISIEDVLQHSDWIMDPEFLILTTFETHNAIHYGDESLLVVGPTIRTPNDTCPWR